MKAGRHDSGEVAENLYVIHKHEVETELMNG